MNERIKELEKQCWDHQTNHLNAEKFAELIVKECLKLNKGQLVVIPKDQEDWDGHNYGFTAAVYGFEDLVKEHFGVEL
jgi:hypothetical protein